MVRAFFIFYHSYITTLLSFYVALDKAKYSIGGTMKNIIFLAQFRNLWISLATKLKFMRALILKIFDYFVSFSKQIPSLILSKIRLLGKDCSNLVLFIKKEDISIKRLIFFVRGLPSYIIKDLKSMSRISSYISV